VFRSRLAGRAVVVLRERGGLLPRVHQRVLVAEAMAAGRTAQETGPGSKAAGELSDLWLAVWACLLDLVARRPARRVGAGGGYEGHDASGRCPAERQGRGEAAAGAGGPPAGGRRPPRGL
jgi:hypothetical protein